MRRRSQQTLLLLLLLLLLLSHTSGPPAYSIRSTAEGHSDKRCLNSHREGSFCETILINENPPVRLRVVPSPGDAAAALLAPHPGVGVWRSLPDCGREEGGERAPVQQERQVQQGHLPSVGNVLAKGGACQFGSLRFFVEKQPFF